ncbi:MAG: ABC transporter permease [Mycobacteriales bacterium]
MTVSTTPPEVSSWPAVTAPSLARDRRRRRLPVSAWLGPIATFLCFLGLWYLVSEVLLAEDQRFLLPPPHEVVRESFFDPYNRADLLRALGLSTTVATVGLAIAIAIGMTVAIVMSQARWVERSLYPYAVILQCIPILALVPVIGFWFEFGFASRVIVCVLIALFPIISNTLFGLRSVDDAHRDLFRMHRAGRLTALRRLELPAALPAIFAGLRISAGLAVIGAIVGDFFFKQGDPGLGFLIDLYRARLQTPQMFGAVILASLLGVAVFWLFGLVSRAAVGKWHESAQYRSTS